MIPSKSRQFYNLLRGIGLVIKSAGLSLVWTLTTSILLELVLGDYCKTWTRRRWKWTWRRIHINSKVCVNTLSFIFDSPTPVYANRMKMCLLTNHLRMLWNPWHDLHACSHQAYRSMIVYKIKFCQFPLCTKIKKEWFIIIILQNFASQEFLCFCLLSVSIY